MTADRPACARLVAVAPAGRSAASYTISRDTTILAERSPDSLHLIDSSIVRAHQHAAGGKKGVRITPSAVLVEG